MSWFWYKRRSASPKTVADWNAPLPELGAGDNERLAALYAWERRLRGYDLYPTPVQLEPDFVPYDSTIGSDAWQSVPQPRDGAEDGIGLAFLSVRLPLEQKVTPAQTLELYSMLRGLNSLASLEIIADAHSIRYQIACLSQDSAAIAAACSHSFPLARIEGVDEKKSATNAIANINATNDALLCDVLPKLAPLRCRVFRFDFVVPAARFLVADCSVSYEGGTDCSPHAILQ